MFKKVLIIVIIIGAAAFWYFGYGPGKSTGGTMDNSNLPPIRVDETSLTKAGQEKLAEVKKSVSRLRRSRKRTWRELKQAEEIAGTLLKLGDFRSSAEWNEIVIEWYEALTPEELDRGKKHDSDFENIAFGGYSNASICYFLLGNREHALELMRAYLKKHTTSEFGSEAMKSNYYSARKNPGVFLEFCKGVGARPEYVK